MSKFSKGVTFGTNDFISAAKLHALIDTAIASSDGFPGTPTLYDIIMSDITSGVRAFHVQDSPSGPVTNDLRVGSDGMLDRYDGAAFVDLTTDFLSLTNTSVAWTLVTGTPVVADAASASSCHIWTGPGSCPEPLGVAVTVAGPGVAANIQFRGIAPVRILANSVAVEDFLVVAAQGATALTRTNTSVNSDVLGICIAAEFGSGVALALLTR